MLRIPSVVLHAGVALLVQDSVRAAEAVQSADGVAAGDAARPATAAYRALEEPDRVLIWCALLTELDRCSQPPGKRYRSRRAGTDPGKA